MEDTLKIKVPTGNTRLSISMNLGKYDEKTQSWNLNMTQEFLTKLMSAFSTPEARATGVEVIFEKGN